MDLQALMDALAAGEIPPWVLPMVALLAPVFSAETLTQVYKMSVKDRIGRKPPRWKTLMLAMLIASVLGTLSWWLYSDNVRMAVLVGITLGPASPIVWVLVMKPLLSRFAKKQEGRGERRRGEPHPPLGFECRRARDDEEPTYIGAVTRWLQE